MEKNVHHYIAEILKNRPDDWMRFTTHRLDIYDESKAKTQFLEVFEALFQSGDSSTTSLEKLPTAYDYIRLGHPLSCILEWTFGKTYGLAAENIISFSSSTAPILAVLRKNLLESRATRILFTEQLPETFNADLLKSVYGYTFDLKNVHPNDAVSESEGRTIYITQGEDFSQITYHPNVDFHVHLHPTFGGIVLIWSEKNKEYIDEIQHVRRRETIAMTPADCISVLEALVGAPSKQHPASFKKDQNKAQVLETIRTISKTTSTPLVASSGLSMQYAIMMGLIDEAFEKYPKKNIAFIVPPNCYGGTNDQARRVAATSKKVNVVDLPVDGANNMVNSLDTVLDQLAKEDAVPYVIVEIPTNPRVEVPDLKALKKVLSKTRKTLADHPAVAPVFILDQTFCPNVTFLAEGEVLSALPVLSYTSGSKFPSGGHCTSGYCVANPKTAPLLQKVEKHLLLCDNEATDLQYEILAKQLPSMNERIQEAYDNAREFVNFIHEVLPSAKINFVSKALAQEGFTPSVFSLDLPTKGNTETERETYKRQLNLQLIHQMITEIPEESKFCVSYGQLKGIYWTIPATSTQGTTKEGDKDYIVRVSLSPSVDLERHKKVFTDFVNQL